MDKIFVLIILLLSFAIYSGCSTDSMGEVNEKDSEYNYVFTFSQGESLQWKAAFADYPVGEDDFYELQSGFATVPAEAGEAKPSFKISGNNHSDDLFMFLYRKLEGLVPNATYDLKFKVELASNAPRNSVGIGGSPGSSVYLKAGAVSSEPELVQESVGEQPYWAVPFEKGNQSQEGTHMQVLGNIGTNLEEFRYTFIERTSPSPLTATTNENGELWIVVGTDSGFEGTTTLYYTAIKVRASKK